MRNAPECLKIVAMAPLAGPGLLKESYDALLDVEQWGVKVRDVDDEFEGAEFRDEKTKLTFAYDYDARHCIRVVGGAGIKVACYEEMKRQGVQMHDFVMATSLLTEGGKQGGRVVGATGVGVRTGEFYIFKAKATILTTGVTAGMWIFSRALLPVPPVFTGSMKAGSGSVRAISASTSASVP